MRSARRRRLRGAALGEIAARLRRRLSQAPAAFPDRGTEPALRDARSKTASRESIAERVDRLKREFYDGLDALQRREDAPSSMSDDSQRWSPKYSAERRRRTRSRISPLRAALRREHGDKHRPPGGPAGGDHRSRCQHPRHRRAAGAEAIREGWPREARQEVLINYLGFPFWDVLTFPVMTWREVGEFNEILVDRISVRDARALKDVERAQKLKGIVVRAYRRVPLARLSRERLPAGPAACAGPAARHRLRFGRPATW